MDSLGLSSDNISSSNSMMEVSKSSQSEGLLSLHNEGSEHGSDMVFEKTLLAPYAVDQSHSTSTKKVPAQGLQAPYAQPVLDGSKVSSGERRSSKQRAERTSVDEKIQMVQERRKQQQAQHERSLMEKKRKSESNILKWEEGRKEQQEKIQSHKQKENERRKEIEARRELLMEETMKRAKAT